MLTGDNSVHVVRQNTGSLACALAPRPMRPGPTCCSIFDAKLAGTDCRVDCLLSYAAPAGVIIAPHGWIPTAIEVFWPPKSEWRRSQSMIIETLLSSIEECSGRLAQPENPPCAINFCPFCSSSFIRLDTLEKSGAKYRCGDCDMTWTMIEPAI